MANKAYVYDGSAWQDLSNSVADLTNYPNMTTTPISGFRNRIINGDFRIAQRGTSATTSGATAAYGGPDRWYMNPSGGTMTFSQQAFTVGQTDVPGEPAYFGRIAVTTGDNNLGLQQRIEDVRTFAGQTVTMSFWAKGTNPAGGYFNMRYIQGFGTGGTAGTVEANFGPNVVVTSSWQKFTGTVTIPSISGKTIGTGSYISFDVRQPNGDTGTAAWTLDIANVQVEPGSIATPFEFRPMQTELALCQRYYYRIGNTGVLMSGPHGFAARSTDFDFLVNFPVTMRANPNLSTNGTPYAGSNPTGTQIGIYGAGNSTNWTAISGGTTGGVPTPTACDNPWHHTARISATTTALAGGRIFLGPSAYIQYDAEL